MHSDEHRELYGSWAQRWPADAAELLHRYSGTWWISGGWAIDAAIGRERPHSNLDIVIPRGELSLLRGWLGSRWQLWSYFAGALKPLRPHDSDVLPLGTSSIWMRRSAYSQWEYEVQLDPSDDTTWRFRRDTAVIMPLGDALRSHGGIRFAAPQIVLAYAALAAPGDARRSEDADEALDTALPSLDADARAWLASRIPGEHVWQARLASA